MSQHGLCLLARIKKIENKQAYNDHSEISN